MDIAAVDSMKKKIEEVIKKLDHKSLTCLMSKEMVFGRQNRKLAVARQRRQNGRSRFIVAQNPQGLLSCSDESFLGTITANLMGSKFHIWDQARARSSFKTQSKRLLGVVGFVPTITTITGSFRIMKAWIPKQQAMQLKNSNTTQDEDDRGCYVQVPKLHEFFFSVSNLESLRVHREVKVEQKLKEIEKELSNMETEPAQEQDFGMDDEGGGFDED